ncbi:MAG: phosphoglycerate mutase [Coxiella sp. (in: Bacteria)]|nr:MAG: phosphoglycerate mutase [Coxiella sp. (in: g-proteobacteria)]
MPKLILLRHGQSQWNKANLFTGWVDVPLTTEGIAEAVAAGKTIAEIPIDCIYTSLLVRAQMTALLAMNEHNSGKTPILIHQEKGRMKEWSAIHSEATKDNCLPMHLDWRLNERYYGELQGANKQETRDKYGDEQVKIWRRSYDVPPPGGESLAMTAERTLPCLRDHITPELEQGHTVLVAAHGNSLRSIAMEIEGLTKEEVLELEIGTGQPIIYEYADATFTKLT